MWEYIIIGVLFGIIVGFIVWYVIKNRRPNEPLDRGVEVNKEQLKTLVDYAAQKKQEDEQKKFEELQALREKQERKDFLKHQAENFKQTKEILKNKLKSQLDEKEWKPLASILRSIEKGGMGIYVLYNQTKGKYYVGQAKELHRRVRDHFKVEEIAMDYIAGDKIHVKFLTANELDASYKINDIEKLGIELFDSKINGYNKTEGNI